VDILILKNLSHITMSHYLNKKPMEIREAGTRFKPVKLFTKKYNYINKPHLFDFNYSEEPFLHKLLPLYTTNTKNIYLKKVFQFIEEVFRNLFKEVSRIQRFKSPFISKF
jgi:hypothetical protein